MEWPFERARIGAELVSAEAVFYRRTRGEDSGSTAKDSPLLPRRPPRPTDRSEFALQGAPCLTNYTL
jgi:hypothetical protein